MMKFVKKARNKAFCALHLSRTLRFATGQEAISGFAGASLAIAVRTQSLKMERPQLEPILVTSRCWTWKTRNSSCPWASLIMEHHTQRWSWRLEISGRCLAIKITARRVVHASCRGAAISSYQHTMPLESAFAYAISSFVEST